MAKKPKDVEEVEVEQVNGAETAEEDKTIVVADIVLPPSLAVIPLFDRPLLPKMMAPIVLGNNAESRALLDAVDGASKYVGLILVREQKEDTAHMAMMQRKPPEKIEEFHKVGVIAKVLQVSGKDGKFIHLMVHVLDRFEIQKVLSIKPFIRVNVEYKKDEQGKVTDELKAYAISVINIIKELVNLNPLFKEQLSMLIGQVDVNQPGMLADLSASMTTTSGQELQRILELIDVPKRIEEVLVLLKNEVEISKLQAKINKQIEERLSTQQREFFLKQQLQEIKKELGLTKGDNETEFEKFEKRLKGLKLTSDEVKARIDEEMEKLKVLERSSPEFNVTRAYLDWLTVLPWGVYTKDNKDINKAAKILNKDHYGLQDVKDRILETISVGVLKGDLAGSIILLVGAPGVGKTSIGQSIARSLGRKFYRFSLGGMRDEAEIKGHRRTYIGALPGKFIHAIKTCNSSNPVIMLDEIDKIGASYQGDPASALLEVLDPEQNKDFQDHYMDVRFDLSKVLFVCTANQLDTIPGPLLDRMEIIRLSGYVLEEKMEIAKKFLIPKQLDRHGLDKKQVKIPSPVLKDMIDGYAREAGVRSLENSIKKILRKSTRKIVEDSSTQIKIGRDDLPDLLGRRMFSEEKVYKKPRAGVIMGLAYTSMGGATLFIEATNIRSKGAGFKQTGQLGKVMVESSEIAYTYVKSLLDKQPKHRKFLEENFIHLHVPAGATPKDGPSAGITMACSLYSLATNQPIIKNAAMTGELTLSGIVMPIGGLKEKVIGAKRAKVTTLLFPADNEKDFTDLDDHIKAGITAHFVSSFEQVLKICFPK
ncbi:MAG: endopeptidase La [Deltaproteobacteria bacterium]|jgi:ATP-dependent Lon protease|nr:endopeptidase La [Deltaproteobacteria bacterium]MBT4263238.1 endopeptidase La [Deltaproteobacteria bacterium]MBT4639013.1 endopeptidase La [Deltaproteobacteria bacterium]MBT7151291.1 endopeptidase La [Deltaproteobacteria bacterium]MBT7711532.1 endopeptidase La [Deltaproteobacteria bacterium]